MSPSKTEDKNKTVERVVKAAFVRYTRLVDAPGQDNPRPVIETARRGDTIHILESEVERAEALDAFHSDAEITHTDEGDIVVVDVREMSDGELAQWIKEDKPKASDVIDLADDDPVLAERLLNAERTATNGKPRQTVNRDLTKIIDTAAGGGEVPVEATGTP